MDYGRFHIDGTNQEAAIRSFFDIIIQSSKYKLEIDDLVGIVGSYYMSDRAYVFEKHKSGEYLKNTYEWCAPGVASDKDGLQNFPRHYIDSWMSEFRMRGSYYISVNNYNKNDEELVYDVLKPHKIERVMAAPIIINGEIVGFLGVDNPRVHVEQELFLSVAASIINKEIILYKEKLRNERHKRELQKALKDAEEANNAKTTFLFNMSHDIRTPLNAIIGYADMMGKDVFNPEKILYYKDRISQSGELLLSIINNILDMARIESGKEELEEIPIRTEDMEVSLISIFESVMSEKNIEFKRVIDITHHYIMCDLTKVREVFNNVLGNAVKYTPRGGSINMITTEIPCDKEGYVTFETSISDNGIGISEEFMPHLFEPFTRELNTTAGKIPGTGLGMPIVKQMLDLMGGTIKVESMKGVGSTFTITLTHPICDAELCEKQETVCEDEQREIFIGKRILLAEDNDMNAEIAAAILDEYGMQVDRAENGFECVNMLCAADAGTYDAILMDVQMPEMDGYEATCHIRGLDDGMKARIPIIALTANAFDEDRRNSALAGMNGHIAKPIDTKALLATLSKVL